METQTEGARTGRGKLLEFQNGQTPVYEILKGAFAENIIEKVSKNQHRTSHAGNPLLYDVVGEMPVRPVISVSCPSHSGRSNLSIFFSHGDHTCGWNEDETKTLLSSCAHAGVKTSGLARMLSVPLSRQKK